MDIDCPGSIIPNVNYNLVISQMRPVLNYTGVNMHLLDVCHPFPCVLMNSVSLVNEPSNARLSDVSVYPWYRVK